MLNCGLDSINEGTYPNPDDADPSSRDASNLGEAPVAVSSDDRRDELGNTECTEEGERWALHEKESVRTGDENKGLRDDGDLKVNNRVELTVVVVDGGRGLECDAELVLEERRFEDHDHKNDTGNKQRG